jgi:hypothetical protein
MLRISALVFVSACASAPGSSADSPAGPPLRRLFVDDEEIGSMSGLRKVLHPVTKFEGNPILLPVLPWEGQYTLLYGTVMRDEEEGLFKAWYLTWNQFRLIQDVYPESTYLCYATSKDGLRWEKPRLGRVEYRGSTENNIVLAGHQVPERKISGFLDSVSVLKDPRDPDPARRYKMMVWHQNRRKVEGKWVLHREPPFATGHYVAFSPDGLSWQERPDPVFPYDPVRDTMTTMWDPGAKKFVAFVKEHVDGKRARFRSESDDFLRWTEPAPMLAADGEDPPGVELYNSTGFAYEGLTLGLLTVIHPTPPSEVYLDVQLVSSRDGRTWRRAGGRKPFIPVGRRDLDWDFGFNSPSSGAPIRVGDELWFYYSGRCYRHPVDGQSREPNHGAIGLGKLRLDGFVSLDSGDGEGVLVTRPVEVVASRLIVNADASQGEIRVELLDADGRPLPGFGAASIRGDSVRHAVDLPRLAGKSVRVRFTLSRASLYSFAL